MKTRLALSLIFIVFTISIPIRTAAQYFGRGHNNDDLYLTGLLSGQYQAALFRFTNNGASMQVMDSIDYYNWDTTTVCHLSSAIADINEGIVYCVDRYVNSTPVSISYDYGQSWSNSAGAPHPACLLASGSQPGEVYLRIGPSDNSFLYYSNDFAQSFSLVRPIPEILNLEVGTEPGELYAITYMNSHTVIFHSIDYGLTYDTIPIDTAIINNEEILSLSRGAFAGELYLASRFDYGKRHIYHSTDYGHTFSLIYTDISNPTDLRFAFTAGRNPCTLYIAHILFDGCNATYWIDYSSNCGQSFSSYEHIFTNLSDKNNLSQIGNLTITPNPVVQNTVIQYQLSKPCKILINIYNTLGNKIASIIESQEQTGSYSTTFDASGLSSGIYYVILEINGIPMAKGKIIKK
jgi:hypothetical protein